MRLSIDLDERTYDVEVVGDGLHGLGPAVVHAMPGTQRAVIVSNETVWPIYGAAVSESLGLAGVDVQAIVIPDGESEKSVERWHWLVDQILTGGVDRKTPVIALGGGVIGDLAGFAAASVMRGVPLVQVPTSLLAMVDSSVGGKTAVNTRHGKNLVGAFYQPSLVYADVSTLRTLDEDELKSGLGEVIKHGVLSDPVLLDICCTKAESIYERDLEILTELVVRSIRVKSSVVSKDEKEAGLRAILNLGHTVGHAIEASVIDTPNALPHGICVAMGLLAEVAWAHARGACSLDVYESVRVAMESLRLPLFPRELDVPAVLAASRFDKKALRGKLNTPIVESIGQVRLIEIGFDEMSEMFYSLPGFRDA